MSPILLLWLAFTDHGYGPVNPVPLPVMHVTRHDGQRMTLAEAIGPGRAAVQFVFTDCRTTCPLLGGLFSRVDRLAGGAGRLVSISVNPTADSPRKLADWRAQFRASETWIALRPDPEQLPALLKAFGQTDPAPAAHALQIFFVESGRYAARTTRLPHADTVAAALKHQDLMAGRNGVRELTLAANHACQNCHGQRLEGGREGGTIVPPLHGLSQTISRRGGPPAPYDPAAFCRAVNTGIDPAGVVLNEVMPRYRLTGAECSKLWDLVR